MNYMLIHRKRQHEVIKKTLEYRPKPQQKLIKLEPIILQDRISMISRFGSYIFR